SQRASMRITASFASSAGWPNRCPPIASHDLLPAAVPAPVPMSNVRKSRNTAIAYTHGVAHSSIRGDVRNVSPAAMRLSASHTSCRCQIVATNVGTSVWPAEYSAASPYRASAATETTSALSSWRTRDSSVDPDNGWWWQGIEQHGNLERRRRGIVRDRHAQLRRGLLVDAKVVRDRPGNERCDGGSVPREFDDRPHHDLGFVRRRKADEPAV